MAHVTFIHGMANKPPPADLLRIWRNTLADAASPLPGGVHEVDARASNLEVRRRAY